MIFLAAIALDVFMRVLDHHYRRIDHRANRNRNAAERHDIGVQSLVMHHQKGDQDTHRQGENGYQGASEMQQKEYRNQRYNDAFFQ